MYAYHERAPAPGREREAVSEAAMATFPSEGDMDFRFDRAFTLQEAADRLGISLRQAEMHVADGSLTAVNVGRGSLRRDLRILDEDLDRFVAARKVAPVRVAAALPGSRARWHAAPTTGMGSFTEAYLNRSIKGRP